MCKEDKRATIVVPVYKDALAWNEKISLWRILEVFKNHTITFVLQEGRSFDYLPKCNKRIRQLTVPVRWLQSLAGYNSMMLSTAFYELFVDYEHILVGQLDTFVFEDRLEDFCQLEYDYYGAPWPVYWRWRNIEGKKVPLTVGNGGFSLRRVSACREALLRHKELAMNWEYSEDMFWSYIGEHLSQTFKCAPLKVARAFSVEAEPEHYIRRNGGKLPFGCHGWQRYSKKFYARAIEEVLGESLEKYYHIMGDDDGKAKAVFANMLVDREKARRQKRQRQTEVIFFSCAQNEPTKLHVSLLTKLQEKAGRIRGETEIPGLYIDFNFGIRLEIPQGDFHVCIKDALSQKVCFDGDVNGKILISMEKYFIPWEVNIYKNNELVFYHKLDLSGQKVFMELGTALGDMLATLPYVLEFGRQHQCQLIGSYYENFADLMDKYVPELSCQDELPDDCYAAYVMGAFQDAPILSPIDARLVPLDKVGQLILGLRQPVVPLHFTAPSGHNQVKPYVCIGVQASGINKCWLYPNGREIITDWLIQRGYEVIDIDGDSELAQDGYVMRVPKGVIDDTGRKPLTERVNLLSQAACFIGGSSGLAWLARAVGTPCVMISGITIPTYEYDTPYRVIEYGTCHGCYNDVRVSIKQSLCPYHGDTERKYECSRKIRPEAVIEALSRCLGIEA